MPEISPEQQEVLRATDNLVVVGRPGSGKTTVALWKARRVLEVDGVADHQGVLFLSFSRGAVDRIAAASRAEMPRSLRTRLKIATYHSLCHEILRAHCCLAGLRSPLQVLPPEEVTITENEAGDAADAELERLEAQESRVRFERFAPLAVAVLRKYPVLRRAYCRAYPLVMVDEYQDTDDAQDEFVRILGEGSQIVCLGDPDQRIYDYRPGVRPDRLARLESEHGFRKVDLGHRNHRNAASGIREYARAILEGGTATSSAIGVLNSAAGHDQLVKKICKAVTIIRALAASKNWPTAGAPTICIMLPTNDLVRMVSRKLNELPDEERRKFRHEVAVDADELALAWDLILGVLDHASAGWGSEGIRRLLSDLARHNRYLGGTGARSAADRLEKWSKEIADGATHRSPFVSALRGLSSTTTERPRGDPVRDVAMILRALKEVPGKYLQRVTDLVDLRSPGAAESRAGATLSRLFSEKGSYDGAQAAGRQCLLMERLLDPSNRRRRLTIMTLHKCKGNEFDAVVLAETSQQPGRFAKPEGDSSDLSKSRRLFHVALTRARYHAFIVTPVFDRTVFVAPRG